MALESLEKWSSSLENSYEPFSSWNTNLESWQKVLYITCRIFGMQHKQNSSTEKKHVRVIHFWFMLEICFFQIFANILNIFCRLCRVDTLDYLDKFFTGSNLVTSQSKQYSFCMSWKQLSMCHLNPLSYKTTHHLFSINLSHVPN